MEKIKCSCGCGKKIEQISKHGYKRKFIHGHNSFGIKFSKERIENVRRGLLKEKYSTSIKRNDPAYMKKYYKNNIDKWNLTGRSMKLSGNPNWNGGILHCMGYIMIKTPHHPFKNTRGYVMEHRLVMEKEIGRYLEPTELVHHINHIKTDNRIENLKITTVQTHPLLHPRERNEKGQFV